MALKRLPEDFRDFLNLLNKNEVEYLLLGGWAVGIYGHPRATGDMDIFIAIEDLNVSKMMKTLNEFGLSDFSPELLMTPGNILRMGHPPLRIEIINQASGIEIFDCYKRRKIITVDGINISLISKDDLIINKKASGRFKDLADVENLESC